MDVGFQPMDERAAASIALWRYDPPYDRYNLDRGDLCELLEGSYWAAMDEQHRLIGFYCTGSSAQVPAGQVQGAYRQAGLVDVGLGLHPQLTGRGLGVGFTRAVLSKVGEHFLDQRQRLTVASFNRRAIKVYEKLGFVERRAFNHGMVEFVIMTREGKDPKDPGGDVGD